MRNFKFKPKGEMIDLLDYAHNVDVNGNTVVNGDVVKLTEEGVEIIGNKNYLNVNWKKDENKDFIDGDVKCVLDANDWNDFYKAASLYLDLNINPFEYFDNPYLIYCVLRDGKVNFYNANTCKCGLIYTVSIQDFIRRLEKESSKKDENNVVRFFTYVSITECDSFLKILEQCTSVVWTRNYFKPTQYNPFKDVYKNEGVLKFYYTNGKLSVYEDDGISKSDQKIELLTAVEFIGKAGGFA